MNTDKKPVDATTAVAKEPLEVTEKDVNEANTLIAEEHYVGKDGDRLFTRDEVSIILRKRIERHDRALLAKYHLSSMQELDELVRFGHDVESLSFRHFKQNGVIPTKKTTLLDVLKYLNKKPSFKAEDLCKDLNIVLVKAEALFKILLGEEFILVPDRPHIPGEYDVDTEKVFGTIVQYSLSFDER